MITIDDNNEQYGFSFIYLEHLNCNLLYFRTNPSYLKRTLKSFSTKSQNYTICIWPFMKASRNWLNVGTTEVVKMSAILSKCWPHEPKYMWHFWTIIKKLWKLCIDAQRRILHLQISPGLSNCVVSKVRGRDNLCHWKICSINLWGGSKNIACAYRWEQLWNFKLIFLKFRNDSVVSKVRGK